MKKILAFNGSPRQSGNTHHLLQAFRGGCGEAGAALEVIDSHALDLKACTGCLRCNVLKRCSLRGDEWPLLETKILKADVLVFASPIYFHHLPAPLKAVLDRFRSFTHVQIGENGLIHTPHQVWNKDFVLLLSQGSPDRADAQPVIDLFRYMVRIMGAQNRLHELTGTRLAMVSQVSKSRDELAQLYLKLSLPESLVDQDYQNNMNLLDSCRALGRQLGSFD